MIAVAVALGLILTTARPVSARAQDQSIAPTSELLAQATELPPASLYPLAAKLFGEDRRDDAVRWLYIAQIRSRFRLATASGLPPDGEPALYGALLESVGRPINEWAFGDIPAVTARMAEALDWDATHANGVTPKGPNRAALEQVPGGLARFRESVIAGGDELRKERAAHGLENR